MADEPGDEVRDDVAGEVGDDVRDDRTTDRSRHRALPGALRLTAAVAAGGAMVWAASALGTTWGADPGRGAALDASSATAPVEPDSFVRSASLTCPGWPADEDGAGLTARVRAATAPEVLGAPHGVGDGATLSAPGEGPPVRFPTGGAQDGLDTDGWTHAAAGTAAAPGLVAAQLVTSADPGLRGLAFTPCRAPADTLYLLGGGEGAGRVEQVVVTNPGADPVRVALEVSGADGPVEVSGGRGLVVPPGGRTAYLLDALAPGVEAPAVTVVAEGGPVGAHLVERASEGTVDLGVEVVPAAAEPARDLVLPALPGPAAADDAGGDRSVTVRFFAPEAEAVVELRALTPDGARVPPDPVVRVPAGGTIDLDLDLGELADVQGLLLRSDAPVTAAAQLHVAPASDEPVVIEDDAADTSGADEAATTGGPDQAVATGGPDEAASTAGPDQAGATARPDDAATTAGPDAATTTAGPDDADVTSAPSDPPSEGPRVVRPAGESAWVTAVALTDSPVGTAIPEVPDPASGPATLAVSVVDAARAQVVWMDAAGEVTTEHLDLANDTTTLLEVPAGTVAAWVRPTGSVGVVAALHLAGADSVGPYLSAASLPSVPWTVPLTQVRPVVP